MRADDGGRNTGGRRRTYYGVTTEDVIREDDGGRNTGEQNNQPVERRRFYRSLKSDYSNSVGPAIFMTRSSDGTVAITTRSLYASPVLPV